MTEFADIVAVIDEQDPLAPLGTALDGYGAAVLRAGAGSSADRYALPVRAGDDLRLAVWVAPPARGLGGDDPFDGRIFEDLVETHIGGAFRALRAAAERMREGEVRDGARGTIVLVAAHAPASHTGYDAIAEALAGMVFTAARDLADVPIRVVGVVPRETASAGDMHAATAALVLHAALNPILNGVTLGAIGRVRGAW